MPAYKKGLVEKALHKRFHSAIWHGLGLHIVSFSGAKLIIYFKTANQKRSKIDVATQLSVFWRSFK